MSRTTLDQFRDHVLGFEQLDRLTERETKANYGLGLAGEAGEVADLIKKNLFHDDQMDMNKLVKELGDVCWYLVAICNRYDLDLADVMAANIEKLQKRHGGTKFVAERSNFGKES